MTSFIQAKKINIINNSKNNFNFSKYFKVNLLNEKKIKKVLIIKWGGMGDVIQSSAIIEDILTNFKNHQIDLNTLPAWKILFSSEKRFNKIWGFTFTKSGLGLADIFKWIIKIRSEKYDLIIDLQTNDRSRIMLSLIRFSSFRPIHIIGNHPVFPYTIKSNTFIDGPFDRMQRTIATIGIKSETIQPKICISKKTRYSALVIKKKYDLKSKQYVAFIPGSSRQNKLKRWGVKNYIKLAELINKKIILIGGPDDAEDCNLIAKNNKNIINLCNKTNLLELIELFRGCQIVIGNDTGTLHLASTTNVPIIQIAGPTNPLLVKPLTNNVISVQADIDCKNCYKKNCSHHSCMKNITADYIYSIIKDTK